MGGFEGRRIARVLVAYEILGAILKCSFCKPGERVESDLPDDAKVLLVYTPHEDIARDNSSVATLVIESDSFDRVLPDQPIPLRPVTFHRFVEAAA